MRDLVSDEVWWQLDPYAGALAVRTRRRLLTALAIAVLTSVGIGVAWHLGVLAPRLHGGMNGTGTRPGEITAMVTITNRNAWLPVEVRGAGRSGPGLELLRTDLGAGRTLAPDESMVVTLVYRVTDCAAVTDRPWPVPVQVARPWGTQTVHVRLPTVTADDAPDGVRTFSGPDPYAVEWQRYFADHACEAGSTMSR